MELHGSSWNRWDLHIHTPGTLHNDGFKGDWEEYEQIVMAAQPKVKALGITDYFTLSSYKMASEHQRNGKFQGLWLFPNIELRLDIQAKKWVNFHLIFSPEDEDHVLQIERLMRNLRFKDDEGISYALCDDDLRLLGKKSKPKLVDHHALLREGASQFKVDIEQIKEIQDLPWARQNMITAVSSKENDGTSGLRATAAIVAAKIEARSNIIFSGAPTDRNHWLNPPNGQLPKPVIFGCDAHRNDQILKPNANKFCWIKGDICFDALRQMLLEPSRRLFIGERPLSASYATINNITLKGGDWFPSAGVSLNEGLIAIIGARGSGKTALADLISLGAQSVDFTDDQSFISRAGGLLNGMHVNLKWGMSKTSVAFDNIHHQDFERNVKYLSQHFVSRICSNENSKSLQSEIEQMIFNALSLEERRSCSTFDQLESLILTPVHEKQQNAKANLENLNGTVIEIAEKLAMQPQLTQALAKAKADVEYKNKDIEVMLAKSTQSTVAINKITAVMKRLESVRTEREQNAANLGHKISQYENLEQSLRVEKRRNEQKLMALKNEYSNKDLKLSLLWKTFVASVPEESFNCIAKNIAQVRSILDAINKNNDDDADYTIEQIKTFDVPMLSNLSTNHINQYLALFSDELQKLGIHSDAYERASKALTRLTQQLTTATADIADLDKVRKSRHAVLEDRRTTYTEFFDSITEEEAILGQLHKPLTERLSKAGGTCRDLEFIVKRVVDMTSWTERGKELFDNRTFNVEQKIKESGLRSLFETGNTKEIFDAILNFYNDNNEIMKSSTPHSFPSDKVSKRLQLIAEWLFSIDHIKIEHGIRYQGVNLERLSSGTKGIVLLLLYLVVDIDDQRPLIIDQPEENLDPNSIFEELVEPFREIRNKRQVIIVTHNANLVINTDVDQVIVANNEVQRSSGGLPHFSYTSGSIENKNVRDLICKTLEGGAQAFLDREKRYRLRNKDQLNLN
jgi:energy-coupling factor transporter ATP-binding protein EcfA2